MKVHFIATVFLFGISFASFSQSNTFPSSGNVGIGTTGPQFPLHINSGSATTARFQNTNGYIDFGPLNNSAAHIYTDRPYFAFNQDLMLVGNPSKIIAYQSNPFRINVGGADRFTILSNGDLGLGTTAPSNVQGWERAMEIFGSGSAKLLVSSNINTVKIGLFAHSNWGGEARGVLATESKHDLAIQTGYFPERMRIKTNTNGGIKTFNPGNKLGVNGTIQAKERKLEVANWPDYVFDPAYSLLELSDLSEIIGKNRHLPDVPTESEVAATGIDLGETNAVLLKKIEELTLYILHQAKEIEVIKSKLEL